MSVNVPPGATLTKAQIATRIPHADDMCLLDAVEQWDAERIVCSTATHRLTENPLREAGRLGSACGVEYAAQAMAIHGALLAGLADASRPRAGLLASMRDVQFHAVRLDDIADALRVEAIRLTGDGQSILYSFSVSGGGQLLVSGRAAVIIDASKVEEKQTGTAAPTEVGQA